MHAAHRSARDQPQVIHAEPFDEQPIMSGNHVIIVVLRKMRAKAVAGLRGFSVADAVGKNDVVARGVEKLARPEEFARKNGREELMSGAAGAVQNQNRVADASLGVARGLPERGVMKAQLRERFTGAKKKILHDKVAFVGRWPSLLPRGGPFAEEDHGKPSSEKP